MLSNMGYVPDPTQQYKMMRNFSNSNPSLEVAKPNGINEISASAINAPGNNNGVHVEYEVSVPIVQSFRHTPYHSLWNLNQWFVTLISLILFVHPTHNVRVCVRICMCKLILMVANNCFNNGNFNWIKYYVVDRWSV